MKRYEKYLRALSESRREANGVEKVRREIEVSIIRRGRLRRLVRYGKGSSKDGEERWVRTKNINARCRRTVRRRVRGRRR